MPRKIPKSHQRDALAWAKNKSKAAFFMEMRLGKSLVAIKWAEQRKINGHHLIVCPFSVVPSWRHELEEEDLYWYDISSWNPFAENALAAGRPGFYIANYERLIKYFGNKRFKPTQTATAPWDTVILDESPRIKSPRAQITKMMLKSVKPKNRALLSGMPDPEGVQDFVTQMIWLQGHFMGCRTFWEWRAAYCKPTPVGDWVPRKGITNEVIRHVRDDAFVLTRKQAGMFDKKVREIRTVRAPSGLSAQLHSAEKNFELDGTHMTDNALVAHTWVERLSAGCMPGYEHHAKDAELLSLLKGELAKTQVVVFARFNSQIKRTVKYLRDAGIGVKMLIGATKNRHTVVENFSSKKFRVLVAQTKCLKAGIDLSAASTLIYLSNYHDYDTRAQSEDRCFHPEKEEATLIIDIVIANSKDAAVPIAMREKSLNAKSFQRGFLGAMLNEGSAA